MRPMRRQDREIKDPEKILSIIAACPYCHLGFSDQGKPYVVPVNFGYAVEDGRTVFYFHGAREGGRSTSSGTLAGPVCRWRRAISYTGRTGPAATAPPSAASSLRGPSPLWRTRRKSAGPSPLVMAHAAGSENWEFPDAALNSVCVYRLEAQALTCKEHL